jgi:hypothetical protein
MGIVCEHHAGCEENIIFDNGVLRHVNITVNPHAISDGAVVIDSSVIPDGAIVSDPISLADNYAVTGLQSISDFHRSVDHSSGAHLSAISDAHRRPLDRASRRVSQDYSGIDSATTP